MTIITSTTVKDWLEWAGSKLLAMPIQRPGPSRIHAIWPEFPHDANTAFGYTELRPIAPRTSADEIPVMDTILELPLLIENLTSRHVVQARLLVWPLSGRYIYTWAKLARMLHSDRRTVIRWHLAGLKQITAKVDEARTRRIESYLKENLAP